MTEQENDLEPEGGGEPEVEEPILEAEDDRALMRFVVGLLLLGNDELDVGLRAARGPEAAPPPPPQEETSGDLFRYLTLGLLARGQRKASKSLRTAYYGSLGTASWTASQLDRWTDNRFARPFRRPVEKRLRSLSDQVAEIIQEGKREEEQSRVYAARGSGAIVDDVVDQLAESEEVDRLLQELVSQKSVSFTSSLMDNIRALAVTADYLLEGMLRKLMRHKPRRELPPSPLEGQPQTMYRPQEMTKGVPDYGG